MRPMPPPGNTAQPRGRRALERLLKEHAVSREQFEVAINHAKRLDEHCMDAVIDTGAMAESAALRQLASIYKTRFVSTEKLEKAGVDGAVLRMLPKKVAQKLGVFPILFDPRTQALSVVAPDLEEQELEKQVQIVSGAREVKVYITRPSAVRAAIRKHYDGDTNAFKLVGARAKEASAGPGGRETSIDIGLGGGGPAPGGMHDTSSFDYGGQTFDFGGFDGGFGGGFGGFGGSPPSPAAAPPPSPTPGPPPGAAPGTPAPSGGPAFPPPPTFFAPRPDAGGDAAGGGGLPPPPQFTIEAPEIASGLAGTPGSGTTAGSGEATTTGSLDYLETLTILVGLLEQGRGGLRGHSAHVARLTRKLCERIGLDQDARHGVMVAALLHDLGKTSSAYHLTALNVHQYEGHRIQAKKTFLSPLRLLDSAHLPASAERALQHLYERWDGQGFPDRLAGKDVPLGSRILALAESYSDLTLHDKNPFRKSLAPAEAWEAIGRHKGTFFDPNLVDLFRVVVLGDDLKSKLLADRPQVLVVDPDPEETTVLELRMLERGYEVVVARDAEEGLERLGEGGFDLLLLEVELTPENGFDLATKARERSPDLPVVFLTRKGDRESVNRGFELGAADYLVKPASPDVVAAKVRQILSREDASRKAGRGVSGSLQEMSLPDVIQILSNGRKTGRLEIQSDGRRGEIQFSNGMIFDARFGSVAGAEAVYALLVVQAGEFTLDPDFKPTERHIQDATESLLLEGMRRLDEAGR